jgi:octaprenyl-diphosphate synthase
MTIEKGLHAVDEELRRQCDEILGPMQEVSRYATEGGRRVRAALLLGAGEQFGERAIRAAAAIELIHAATLLQDDVFDAGLLRRGRTAAHIHFGQPITILASDWLLIRSLELAAGFDPRFFRQLSRAGTRMAQAEAQELQPPVLKSLEQAGQYGCTIASGKTAALFEATMCGAAILRGLDSADTERWETIGCGIGLTYQMVDDCVDIYATACASQKTVGADLPAGCLTIPVLLAITRLQQRGIDVPLETVQAGTIEGSNLLQLRAALHSKELKLVLRQLLEDRLASHKNAANGAGIPVAGMDTYFVDLQSKLEICFPELPRWSDALSARLVCTSDDETPWKEESKMAEVSGTNQSR